jgi:hypothetical protein
MGTRSKTNVLDCNGNIIISIYRQFDGDIERHGRDLKKFLKRNRLANRINKETQCPSYNEGMEDLAGELFCYLKAQTKHVMPAYPATNNDFAFEYEVGFFEAGTIQATINDTPSKLYIKCRYYDYEKFKDTEWAFI